MKSRLLTLSAQNLHGLSLSSLTWIVAAIANAISSSGFLDGLQVIAIIGFLIFGGAFAYRPPVHISFIVGDEELHEVEFVHSEAITDTRIFIDEEPFIRSDRFWHEPRVERFQFQVGDVEVHEVRIERIRSRLGALWSGTTFNISVDGTLLTFDQVELKRQFK